MSLMMCSVHKNHRFWLKKKVQVIPTSWNDSSILISFQPMQLQPAKRWSKTRSVLLGKWPKCFQFSGIDFFYFCVFECECMSVLFSKLKNVWDVSVGVEWVCVKSHIVCVHKVFFPLWSDFREVFSPVCLSVCSLQRGEWKCVDA